MSSGFNWTYNLVLDWDMWPVWVNFCIKNVSFRLGCFVFFCFCIQTSNYSSIIWFWVYHFLLWWFCFKWLLKGLQYTHTSRLSVYIESIFLPFQLECRDLIDICAPLLISLHVGFILGTLQTWWGNFVIFLLPTITHVWKNSRGVD